MTDTNNEGVQDHDDNEDFEVEEILADTSFLEFLKRSKLDSFDPEASKEERDQFIINMFEVFTNRQNVIEKLRTLAKEKIKKDLGLELEEAQLKFVDIEVERIALQDPDRILDLSNQLVSFEGFPGRILELEGKLGQMGNSTDFKNQIEELERQKRDLEGAKDSLSIIGRLRLLKDSAESTVRSLSVFPRLLIARYIPSWERKLVDHEEQKKKAFQMADSVIERVDSLKSVKERFGNIGKKGAAELIRQTSAKINQTKEQLRILGIAESTLERARKSFDQIRREIIGSITDINGLKEAIQAKIKERFQHLTKDGDSSNRNELPSLKGLEEAKRLFRELEAKVGESGTEIDPFGGIDNKEKLAEAINNSTVEAIGIRLHEILDQNRKGTSGLDQLERALGSILKTKEVGFVVGEEAKEAMAKIFDDSAANIFGTDKIKAILLKKMADKIRSGKYQTS